jgi:FixJ family two-component response regulator
MATTTPMIAVVENDRATRIALGRLLRALGFEVASFESGEAFFAGTADWPDCLLLDVALDGMSGLQVQRYLQLADAGVPIIFVSGQDDPRTVQCARKQGCSAFLIKPVSAHLLAAAIGLALQQGRRSAGGADD